MSAPRVRAALTAGVALAALGCATLPPCPAKGGPPWSELSTRHFHVRTDLAADDADELARRLEETRAVLMTLAWPNAPDPPGRWNVIGYLHWSLIDNFEWSHGYDGRFGLYTIDFARDPTLARRPTPAVDTFREAARALGTLRP